MSVGFVTVCQQVSGHIYFWFPCCCILFKSTVFSKCKGQLCITLLCFVPRKLNETPVNPFCHTSTLPVFTHRRWGMITQSVTSLVLLFKGLFFLHSKAVVLLIYQIILCSTGIKIYCNYQSRDNSLFPYLLNIK